jgi:hypothetical protein
MFIGSANYSRHLPRNFFSLPNHLAVIVVQSDVGEEDVSVKEGAEESIG